MQAAIESVIGLLEISLTQHPGDVILETAIQELTEALSGPCLEREIEEELS